jgi:intracellular septation protein A
MLFFDIGGPLALYWLLLHAAGTSEVTALIVSGILPAVGMALSIVKKRRIDAIGALVLLGIVTGTVLGLATHSARLVLMEGSVPTAIFGLACLASLLTSKPMLQRIAEQTTAGTARGRMLMAKAAQPAGRHAFRLVTVVWGVTFLVEAAARVGIVESFSAGNALLVVKVMPYVIMFLLMRWTGPFIRRSVQRDGAGQADVQDATAAQDATAVQREAAMIG